MDEGTVRQQASMFALVAQMEAIKAEPVMMEQENYVRLANKEALAWDGAAFSDCARTLRGIAEQLVNDI